MEMGWALTQSDYRRRLFVWFDPARSLHPQLLISLILPRSCQAGLEPGWLAGWTKAAPSVRKQDRVTSASKAAYGSGLRAVLAIGIDSQEEDYTVGRWIGRLLGIVIHD